MASISAVIHTLNEERNLPFALRSVRPWVDEIVVVDMASDDGTADVARSFGARVVGHERVGFVEPAREFGYAQAIGDWMLALDADEVVPAPLSRRLRAIAAADEADVVRLSRRNYLLGEPLLHSGWNPERDRLVRFFKRGLYRPGARVHEQGAAPADARVLDLPAEPDLSLVHFNYLDVTHFLDKLNRYTSIEAEQAAARGERAGAAGAMARAMREWAARFLWHQGYKDGWRGLALSGLMGAYHLAVYAKRCELDDSGSREAVMRRYADEAERLLAAYGPSSPVVRPLVDSAEGS